MINKEFIVKDGAIYKDFIDRNIPQNSNNQVCVSVLIPASAFVGNNDYAVILAVAYRQTSTSATTTLNSLVLSASKSITLDGVLYVKYSAVLSYDYTQNLGQLLFSPYIRKIIHEQGEYDSESDTYEDIALISEQQAYTYVCLNVIKSVLPQYDASLEDGTTADAIIGMIEGKKIYTFIDLDSASLGEHYYNLVNDYNPNATQFEGCIVISVYDGETRQYMPYLNDGDIELLEITKDGKFYVISDVYYDSGTTTYTYTRTQLSYSKSEIDTNFYKKTETYNKVETDTLLDTKVNKTQEINGHALSGNVDITKGDVGLGNVENYSVESVEPTASGSQLYITSKAVYDALQLVYAVFNDYTTTTDFNALNSRVEDIEVLVGDSDGDDDNIINTLKEVIQTLSGLGEDANILSMINSKASQSDFDTLNNQINATNGIADKVDILSERDNAYMEITNAGGTIDILTTDWVSNTGDLDYPYKWELTNGYLVGATNVIIDFTNDSDTSRIGGSVGIDDENGKVILYASSLPSETIKINKIAVFNDLNSYINYSNQVVQDVNTLKTQVNDINNTKLPQYVFKRINNNNLIDQYDTYVDNINTFENGGTHKVGLTITKNLATQNGLQFNALVNENGFIVNAIKKTGSTYTTHTLKFDIDGNLKIDGVAVGGGGSQLYQHNILITYNTKCYISLEIINQSNTPYTIQTLLNELYAKGYTTSTKMKTCNGVAYYGSNLYIVYAIGQDTNNSTTCKHLIGRGDGSYLNVYENLDLSSATLYDDNIIAL